MQHLATDLGSINNNLKLPVDNLQAPAADVSLEVVQIGPYRKRIFEEKFL